MEAGGSRRSAARRFGVSASAAVKLAQRVEKTGSIAAAKQGRPPGGGKLSGHVERLIGWVEAQGDATLAELAARLAEETGVTAHPRSIGRVLQAAGYS